MGNRLRAAALGLILAASLAGCVSIPTGGPVQSSTVTQGAGGQGQHYMQLIPKPPVAGWDPREIVQGFLTASASFGYRQIALEYLVPAARAWNPAWSALVYSDGPTVNAPDYQAKGGQKTARKAGRGSAQQTATVTISGTVQAKLNGTGGYAVPSASAPVASQTTFYLVKLNGQWRISIAPQELLLTSYLFNLDYQPRNLYFFDPTFSYLVPDPAYVPLQATSVDLMRGLVDDLIRQPDDWLSRDATATAFPDGTRLNDVTLNGGTAMVNLTVPAGKASDKQLREQMSAQLLYTLSGSGQGGSAVQSVELSVNGTPWTPPYNQGNPVQQLTQSKYWPPQGASGKFYYLDSAGNVLEHDVNAGTTAPIARLGRGYSQIAVSPAPQGSQYIAALTAKGGALYTGPLNGKLTRERGTGYQSMSWDPQGNLWAITNNQIVQLPAADSPGQPLGRPVSVDVFNSDGTPNTGPFSALRVAPDGVRMAIIVQGQILNFGAIVYPQGTPASQPTVKIYLSPFYVPQVGASLFSSVTWYGPDDVITLSEPNQALTEYPVNGGSSTDLPSPAHIGSITASYGSPLIAGLVKGGVTADASPTGAWPNAPIINKGISPVYPG